MPPCCTQSAGIAASLAVLGVKGDLRKVCVSREGHDAEDQRARGEEQETGGRGDGHLFRNLERDSGSSQGMEGRCMWTLPRS